MLAAPPLGWLIQGPTMTPELHWLALTLLMTAVLAFPYVLNRLAVRGLRGVLANPTPADAPLAAWAQRAQRAHANAVENLVLFAPAALGVHLLGRGDSLTSGACAVYFAARAVHYGAYTLGIPGVRTAAYGVGFGASIVLIARLLGWL